MLKRQDGSIVIYALLAIVVLIAIAGAYVNFSRSRPTSNDKGAPHKKSEITVAEGAQTQTVDDKTLLTLPSGATVDLNNFTFDPDKNNGEAETNAFKHSSTFKAYHKGYLYSFSNYSCKTGQVTHDDYTSTDRLSCSFAITTERSVPPSVASYDGINIVVASQSRQIYDHSLKSIGASPGAAYYDVEVPYMQFWGLGDGTYWGAIGNTLRIKTVYGIGEFNFDEKSIDSDVRNKTVKSVQIGPMTAHVRMSSVSCYPPYLVNGQCSPYLLTDGPNKGKTAYVYNHIDYAVNFTQSQNKTADQLILHY